MEIMTSKSLSDRPAEKRRIARRVEIGTSAPRRDPALEAFEKELLERLGRAADGATERAPAELSPRPSSRDINDWIVSHAYVGRCAQACASKKVRGAALAEEVAKDALSRLWEDLRADPGMLCRWDGRRGGYWPRVISCKVADSLEQALRTRTTIRGRVRSSALDDELLGVCEPELTQAERREEELERASCLKQVWRAYRMLPPKFQDAVQSMLLEGQSCNRAKNVLGVKCHKTAKKWYEMGIELMRAWVREYH